MKKILKTLIVCGLLLGSVSAYAKGKSSNLGKRVDAKENHHYDHSNLPSSVVDSLKQMSDGNLNSEELEDIKLSLTLYSIEHFPCTSMKKWITSHEAVKIAEKEINIFVETYNHLDFVNVSYQFDRTKAHMKTACRELINSRH